MKAFELAMRAKNAQPILAGLSEERRNRILKRLEESLEKNKAYIMEENEKDVLEAKKEGLPKSLVERLKIDEKVIEEMRASLRDVIALPDPLYEIESIWKRPNGLLVGRMRIPIGVILVIYESRPNVTVDAFSLCLKSGNAVILKGGSEALNSNIALYNLIKGAIEEEGITDDFVQLVKTKDHAYVTELLKLDQFIDLVIPRGGEGLIRTVVEQTKIPVLKHYKGVCHIFVDESADLSMAEEICLNAKVQKPATCNAMETLLVHKNIALSFLPSVGKRFKEAGVRLKGCEKTLSILKDKVEIEKAEEEDWYEEYLDLVLSIKVVENLDEAISHIRKYGSNHTEAIITRDYKNAMRFIKEVDSSLVLINASTRLNDGYQLGLGAEMGISTTKLHAFGPMGLKELTITKFIAFGDGQLRL